MAESTLKGGSKPAPLVLRPTRGWSSLNLRDLWVYRELIYFLTWRDLKVRYKQTILGAAWAVLQPFMQMVVFTFLFGRLANFEAQVSVPYPIFSYTGLLPWGLFAKAMGDAGRSIVLNRNMITKVYFPRLVVPIASVLGGFVDFGIAFVVLLGMMVYYGIAPTAMIWTLPFFLLLTLITALGAGLWLTTLNVIYRDVGYVIPFLTQFWLFLTPIIYPASEIPARWQLIYALNPMVGVVEGFRWALLGTRESPGAMLGISAAISIAVLVSGAFYFRRMERTFADMV
jgi:lipopolysaccharide transport system permease protein